MTFVTYLLLQLVHGDYFVNKALLRIQVYKKFATKILSRQEFIVVKSYKNKITRQNELTRVVNIITNPYFILDARMVSKVNVGCFEGGA